jgi:hypothetical protein
MIGEQRPFRCPFAERVCTEFLFLRKEVKKLRVIVMSLCLPQSVLNTNCKWIPAHFNCGDVCFL